MLTDTLYTICVRQEAGYCGIGKVLFYAKVSKMCQNWLNQIYLAETCPNHTAS